MYIHLIVDHWGPCRVLDPAFSSAHPQKYILHLGNQKTGRTASQTAVSQMYHHLHNIQVQKQLKN